ncbi:MAG: hypothetical protein JWN86_972 [Planctomycetota bacterium]|nr:hypothetical protein [Planctomycetota bacterium]
MNEPTVDCLVERLDRLERENLWLKRIGGGAIVVALAVLALGTNCFRAPQLAAEKFVLNDAQGHPRAKLEIRPDGSPALCLLDPQGHEQVLLQATADGSSRLDYYHNRSLRASLANTVGIGSSIHLLNRSPHSHAQIFMAEDGSSGLNLNRDARGVTMNVQNDGTSKISLTDHDGEDRAGMIVAPDGSLSNLYDPNRPKSTYTGASEEEREPILSRSRKHLRSQVPTEESKTHTPVGGTMGQRATGAA